MGEFDPYHKWLGVPPGPRPPEHFVLLGLASDERDPEVIRNAAARQGTFVRRFQIANELPCAEVLEQIALAEREMLAAARAALVEADADEARAEPEEDAERFRCECGKRLKLPESLRGQRVKCPDCGRALPRHGLNAAPSSPTAHVGRDADMAAAPAPTLRPIPGAKLRAWGIAAGVGLFLLGVIFATIQPTLLSATLLWTGPLVAFSFCAQECLSALAFVARRASDGTRRFLARQRPEIYLEIVEMLFAFLSLCFVLYLISLPLACIRNIFR